MAGHDVRGRRTVMSSTLAGVASAVNFGAPHWPRVHSAVLGSRSRAVNNEQNRKDHGRGGCYPKRSNAANLVDQDCDEKAEQREAIKARHDAAQQCQNPSVSYLRCGEGTDHTQSDRKWS
jgi:hypothetical protein